MARAVSWNLEVIIDEKTLHPLEVGEFGEGEEGRIDIADGSRKYKVRDQIFDCGEVTIKILIRSDFYEYNIMQDWCITGAIKNVYLVYRDSAGNAALTYVLKNTECAMGKLNAFNRNSKEVNTKVYTMLPEYIERIV